MKKFAGALILYIVLFGGILVVNAHASFASCQVVYGGGEICQNQKDVQHTFSVSPTPTSSPTPAPTTSPVPPTTALPSTGTSFWSILLIGASGLGGALLLLL